jgi:hypothetical protein
VIRRIRAIPGSCLLAVVSEAGAQLWDSTRREPVSELLRGVRHLRASPSGQWLVTIGEESADLWQLSAEVRISGSTEGD